MEPSESHPRRVAPISLRKGLTFSPRGFQTLIHGASAVDQGVLAGGAPVGAVPLTAVTLHAIRWKVFELYDLKDERPRSWHTGLWGAFPRQDSRTSARDTTEPPCGQAFEQHLLSGGFLGPLRDTLISTPPLLAQASSPGA